jgi:hypothetical protein
MPDLSPEQIKAIRYCASHIQIWHPDLCRQGLTDADLWPLLDQAIGHGMTGMGDCLSTTHNGKGLRIWVHPASESGPPTIKGQATLDLVRSLFEIPDPSVKQLSLF